jgi:hypothetical protein
MTATCADGAGAARGRVTDLVAAVANLTCRTMAAAATCLAHVGCVIVTVVSTTCRTATGTSVGKAGVTRGKTKSPVVAVVRSKNHERIPSNLSILLLATLALR